MARPGNQDGVQDGSNLCMVLLPVLFLLLLVVNSFPPSRLNRSSFSFRRRLGREHLRPGVNPHPE